MKLKFLALAALVAIPSFASAQSLKEKKALEVHSDGNEDVYDLLILSTRTRVYKASITATPTGAEQDTGLDLPDEGIVHGCWVDVTTAEATAASKLIDVGLLSTEAGGDADGFLDGVSVASTGTVTGTPTFTAATETYFASSTVGDLLAPVQLAGADVATDVGTYIERPHILNGTAKSLVYDADGADWAEFRGDIYCLVTEW